MPLEGDYTNNAPCIAPMPIRETIKHHHNETVECQNECINMLNSLASDVGVILKEEKTGVGICNMLDEAIAIKHNAVEIQSLIAMIRDILI